MVRPRHQKPALGLKNGRLTFVYRAYDRESGQVKRTRHTFPAGTSYDDATSRMQAIMAGVNAANLGPAALLSSPAPLTFEQFLKGPWALYLQTKNVRRSTIASYDSTLVNHVLPAIGGKLLKDVTAADISALFGGLKGYSAKYRKNIYGLLATVFELARQYKLITETPVLSMVHRPQGVRRRMPGLSVGEVQRVLEQIPEEHKALHWTVALTGLRAGELLGLRWQDIDFARATLRIEKGLWRGDLVDPKTEESKATLHMPGILAELLRTHKERSNFVQPADYVFSRADGWPQDPDHLRNVVLYPAMERAGIERTPRAYGYHIFRRTAARIVHAVTRDLKSAQDLLRHSRVQTTADIYLVPSEEVAGDATEILAREISGKLGTDKVQ